MSATVTKLLDVNNKAIFLIVNDGAASDDTDTKIVDVSTLYGSVQILDFGATPAAYAVQSVVTQATSNATGTVLKIVGDIVHVSLGKDSPAFNNSNLVNGFNSSGDAVSDTPSTVTNASRVDVIGLWWTIQGANRVLLEWDASTDDRLISLGGNGKLNRADMYALKNPESTGVTGDILANWTSGANTGYTIILEVDKEDGFEYPNSTY